MGSDGDRSQVTLQVQLVSDRSQKSVQTELDLTVKEFKLVLADLTGIPSDRQFLVYKGRILKNPQTLRSYELEPDQTIHLVRTALPPSKPVVSLSRNSTAISPGETNGMNETNIFYNRPQIQPLNENLDIRAIIKSIPKLCEVAQEPEVAKMLENPVILRCVLSYLFYLEINRGKARHGAHKGDIDNFVQILFSDATFLRHYKKQGESIDRAITAMLGWDDHIQDQSSSGVSCLGTLPNGHCSPYQKLVCALPDDMVYNSSCSSNDDGDGIALEEESEELLALQLEEMEEMGFLNREENLRALLKSGADVEEAVVRLLEKTCPDEGQ